MGNPGGEPPVSIQTEKKTKLQQQKNTSSNNTSSKHIQHNRGYRWPETTGRRSNFIASMRLGEWMCVCMHMQYIWHRSHMNCAQLWVYRATAPGRIFEKSHVLTVASHLIRHKSPYMEAWGGWRLALQTLLPSGKVKIKSCPDLLSLQVTFYSNLTNDKQLGQSWVPKTTWLCWEKYHG